MNWRERIIAYKAEQTGYDSFGILTTYKDSQGLNITLGNKVIDTNMEIGVVIFNPLWNDWAVDYDYGDINSAIEHLTETNSKYYTIIRK